MEKPQVRELARKFGLVVADKPESQEICFIPENDYRLFLEKKNIQFTPGFFKMKDGSIVGKHSGKEKFTIGQRKGLGISWKSPLYVVGIEDDGTVRLGEEEETYCSGFVVEDVTFQGMILEEKETIHCKVQIRYRHSPILCKITLLDKKLHVTPLEEVQSVTPGQSAVFYPQNGEYLLMGGIIEKGSIKNQTKSLRDINISSILPNPVR